MGSPSRVDARWHPALADRETRAERRQLGGRSWKSAPLGSRERRAIAEAPRAAPTNARAAAVASCGSFGKIIAALLRRPSRRMSASVGDELAITVAHWRHGGCRRAGSGR